MSTVSHHFAEQVHKTEIEKAHVITREGGAHSQLLSCSHLSRRLLTGMKGPGQTVGLKVRRQLRTHHILKHVLHGHRHTYNFSKKKRKRKLVIR